MILITGASGKTGKALIRSLAAAGHKVRALVRKPDQRAELLALGAAETIVGDMCCLEDITRAAEGVLAIYHIPPNVSADELRMGEIAIQSALASGVERFVYHSVLHPQIERMPHHWEKLRVEERLMESTLNFTVLQPAAYMQNILGLWMAIIESGVYEVPYSVETRLSVVDLDDVAEAARIVLTESGHDWAFYELAGPQPLSQLDIAHILSEEINRPVVARRLPIETWKKRTARAGMGDYAMRTLIAMFNYYDDFGLKGNSRVLETLIGRSAEDFRSFVRRTMEAG
jgi:uncharacterized protein YbjT (DUF2867 family)